MRILGLAITLSLSAAAQSTQIPTQPLHDSGRSVTGAFEGWFRNADGTFSILIGYFNRNLREVLDIPIGPDNRIEPSGPDHGQPTHFLPRRQWGVFTITVPKDFGTGKFTWTLVANGQTNSIPLHLDPLWEISPYFEVGYGNTPPVVRFAEDGPSVQGPRGLTTAFTATVGKPLPLSVWVSDDAKASANARLIRTAPVVVTWSQFRGPGAVTFASTQPAVQKVEGKPPAAAFAGKASTTATFSEAGEYVLLMVANDWSGDGGRGFQCCWTPAHVKVTVSKEGR